MIAISIKQLRPGASDKSSDNGSRQQETERDVARHRYPSDLRQSDSIQRRKTELHPRTRRHPRTRHRQHNSSDDAEPAPGSHLRWRSQYPACGRQGVFGATAACAFARVGHSVDLSRKNDDLLRGASFANQGRLHLGYHYPRSPFSGSRPTRTLSSENTLKWFPVFNALLLHRERGLRGNGPGLSGVLPEARHALSRGRATMRPRPLRPGLCAGSRGVH